MESNSALNPDNLNHNLTTKSRYRLQGAMFWLAHVLMATLVLLVSKPIDAYRINNTGK